MNGLEILGCVLVCGIVCGIISSVILVGAFYDDIQNIVRYLDSIRKEVDNALDELSGAEK